MPEPKISVLLPAYNCEKYIFEAINSILVQTFSDFEMLVIDDGSTDKTSKIIKSYHDPRIHYVKNKKNLGLTKTLNIGLIKSKCKYIARMDADDVSLPDRLAIQYKFMEANKDIGICGTWFETIGSKPGVVKKYPTDPQKIKCELLFGQELAHPTVIMRNSFIKKFKLKYDESFKDAEDYDFFVRAARVFKLANISQVLFLYRRHNSQKGFEDQTRMNNCIKIVQQKQLLEIRVDLTSLDADVFLDLTRCRFKKSLDFIYNATLIYLKIIIGNTITGYFPKRELAITTIKRWLFAVKSCVF